MFRDLAMMFEKPAGGCVRAETRARIALVALDSASALSAFEFEGTQDNNGASFVLPRAAGSFRCSMYSCSDTAIMERARAMSFLMI
jgi:hypothetical protein